MPVRMLCILFVFLQGAVVAATKEDKVRELKHLLEEEALDFSLEHAVALIMKNQSLVNEQASSSGVTALIRAAYDGKDKFVTDLCTCGDIDINIRDNMGSTALIYAARWGHIKCLHVLLGQSSIEVDLQDEKEYTALMYAAEYGHIDCVKALLEKRVDVNVQNKEGMTAFMLAIAKGHKDCADELLNDSNINLKLKDKYGNTVLMYAGMRDHKEGVDQNASDVSSDEDKGVENSNDPIDGRGLEKQAETYLSTLLIRDDIELNQVNEDGDTALHFLTKNASSKPVNLLVNRGANPNIVNKEGKKASELAKDDDVQATLEKAEKDYNQKNDARNVQSRQVESQPSFGRPLLFFIVIIEGIGFVGLLWVFYSHSKGKKLQGKKRSKTFTVHGLGGAKKGRNRRKKSAKV